MLSSEPQPLQWALPEGLDVPPDQLKLRLDFYCQAIVMQVIEEGVIESKIVSAQDIGRMLARHLGVSSGFLPPGALWWRQLAEGPQVALWRKPQVTRVALQEEALAPAARFTLPLPGLVFLCSPGHPPGVWAVKRRPSSPNDILYHAPLFNLFASGQSCPGNHRYGQDVERIPEEFFTAFFSRTGDSRGRSRQHWSDLRALWQELDGQPKYPNDDLVEAGRLGQVMGDLRLFREE